MLLSYDREEKEMKKYELRKGLVIGIIVLFFVAGITTNLSGKDVFATNDKELKEKNIQIGTCNLDTQTFYPTDDASVKQYEPNTNYGTSYLVVRNKYGGGGYPGYEDDLLIKFDISDISAGAIITSATLNLYYNNWLSNNPAGRTLTMYKVTDDWDEDTVTWNTRPSYDSEMTSSAVVPGSPGIWMEWDVTSDVQDFVNGQQTNYGWQIMDETYWGTFDIPAPRFKQKEVETDIPFLEIEVLEPHMAFLFGRIENLNTEGYITTFDAVKLRYLQFSPFSFNTYVSGEKIAVVGLKMGILTTNFAFGFFNAALL